MCWVQEGTRVTEEVPQGLRLRVHVLPSGVIIKFAVRSCSGKVALLHQCSRCVGGCAWVAVPCVHHFDQLPLPSCRTHSDKIHKIPTSHTHTHTPHHRRDAEPPPKCHQRTLHINTSTLPHCHSKKTPEATHRRGPALDPPASTKPVRIFSRASQINKGNGPSLVQAKAGTAMGEPLHQHTNEHHTSRLYPPLSWEGPLTSSERTRTHTTHTHTHITH